MKKAFDGIGLQFWDTHPPSRRDAMIVLMRSLQLLSDALPLAMRSVGTADPRVQERFWESYQEFNRHYDITMHAETSDASGDFMEQIGCVLDGWREMVESRVGQPTGEIK